MTTRSATTRGHGHGQPGGRPTATGTDTFAAAGRPSCGHRNGQATTTTTAAIAATDTATTAATVQAAPAIPPVAVAAQLAAGWPRNWPRPQRLDPRAVADTLGWIAAKTRAAEASATGPVPELGDAAWCALGENDPARWVAVCRAAAAWLRELAGLGERVRTEAREELARFELAHTELILAEDQAARAQRRAIAKAACAGIERRERAAKRTDPPNRTGPELIAAAYASWGLAPPAPDFRNDPAPISPSTARSAA